MKDQRDEAEGDPCNLGSAQAKRLIRRDFGGLGRSDAVRARRIREFRLIGVLQSFRLGAIERATLSGAQMRTYALEARVGLFVERGNHEGPEFAVVQLVGQHAVSWAARSHVKRRSQ
jgi:hypothetical protein